MKISDGLIGGIAGGLLFLLVASILAVIAVKIFNRRKQRERAMRYGKHANMSAQTDSFYCSAVTSKSAELLTIMFSPCPLKWARFVN